MKYPVREHRFEEYDCSITFEEPSYAEAEALRASREATEAMEQLLKKIKTWTCTDKENQPLPVSLEGIKQLPSTLVVAMTRWVFVDSARGDSDPKANSASLPTIQPGQEATALKANP